MSAQQTVQYAHIEIDYMVMKEHEYKFEENNKKVTIRGFVANVM